MKKNNNIEPTTRDCIIAISQKLGPNYFFVLNEYDFNEIDECVIISDYRKQIGEIEIYKSSDIDLPIKGNFLSLRKDEIYLKDQFY